MRGQHGHQGFDNAGGGVELAAFFAFGAGKLAKKVFIDLAQHVARLAGAVAKADGGYQIDQFAQLAIGQLGAGVALVQNAFELGVLQLDQRQRVVNAFANVGLLGARAQVFPAGTFGHPEHVVGGVVVAVFEFGGNIFARGIAIEQLIVGVAQALGEQCGVAGKAVRDVFDKNQAQHQVLVFGRIHVGAQLVSRGPEGFFNVVEHVVTKVPWQATDYRRQKPGVSWDQQPQTLGWGTPRTMPSTTKSQTKKNLFLLGKNRFF